MTRPLRPIGHEGPSAAEMTRRGLTSHQAGDLAAAAVCYRHALALEPGQPDALHLLGVAHLQRGEIPRATLLIGNALGVDPRHATAQSNLGNCLRALNRPGEALTRYDRALSLKPDFVDAHNNRGNVLQDLGRFDEAIASFRTVLAIAPGAGAVYRNLANTMRAMHRLDEALAAYGHALMIAAADVEALIGQGSCLRQLLRPVEALASFDRAIGISPGHLDALNDRGVILLDLKRPEDALASFERVLEAGPSADALSNRGAALHALRRWREALASCCRALALEPARVEALNNRANVIRDLGQAAESLPGYARALAIQPSYAEALSNHGNVLRLIGRYDEAIADFEALTRTEPDWPYAEGTLLHARMNCCDWLDLENRAGRLSAAVRQGKRACTPFAFFSVTGSEQEQSVCGEVFCRDNYPIPPAPLWAGERYDHERIRVAYLSADFREHAISVLLAGLFERHDRRRFEIIALSFGPAEPSPMRTRLQGAFDRFIDVRNESDRSIAELVRRLEIDIAIDLMGHTHGNRLGVFAWRPAPVSVNFFCPTDAPFIDYMIADPVAIPEENRRFHRERIAYLPDTFLATDSSRRIAERTPSRTELGLPKAGFVFCCFNNTYKLNPATFAIWMRLLRQIDGSVLWLQQIQPSATENLRRETARAGIDPARLVFAPRLPSMEDHLARYRQADLFLDTLPFNAQTTAADALWAGLPVLTCLGTTFVGRVAAGLLHAIGLPELVTGSPAAYEARALELARDRNALAQIRAKLAANRDTHPLFDTDRYRRHVESAYLAMWERAQRGLPPETFVVPRQP